MMRLTLSFILGSMELAAPAFAQETAADVLARTRAALGYDRLASHPRGIEAKGSVSVVGVESTYALLIGGERAIVQQINGPLSMASAIDGDTVWVRDIGGETRVAEGSDRDEAVISLLIVSGGFVGGRSPMVFTLDAAESTPERWALDFTLKDGPSTGTVFVDRATSLPSAWTFGGGALTSSVTVGDYKEFGGVKLPGTVSTSSSAGSVVGAHIEAIADAPTFIRSPYQLVPIGPQGFGDTAFDAAVPPELEVVKAPTGHLLVHPLINGKDLGWFIFDTGAGSMVLSTPVITELGLETFGDVPANGIGGTTSATFCRPESVTLGPVTMREPLMVGIDLSFLEQYMGRRVAGLVGYNLLARVVAKIDMETPAIALYDPAAFSDPSIRWEKLVIDQRLPHAQASFEDHKGLFRLDTGAGGSVSLHEPAVRTLKLLDGRETTDSHAGGVGGTVALKEGTLAWFELGGRRMENVEAGFATEAKGAFADPYSLGNIGGELLKPFVLVTDYRQGRIAFVERAANEAGSK